MAALYIWPAPKLRHANTSDSNKHKQGKNYFISVICENHITSFLVKNDTMCTAQKRLCSRKQFVLSPQENQAAKNQHVI
jgi:hypothetical protein